MEDLGRDFESGERTDGGKEDNREERACVRRAVRFI
jgi:hypothetical protein